MARLFRAGLVALLLAIPSLTHTALGIEGVLLVRTTYGDLKTRPAVLRIPDHWKGSLQLVLPGGTLSTTDFAWTKVNDKDTLVVVFPSLPAAKGHAQVPGAFALKGVYVPQERFSGELFSVPAAPNGAAPDTAKALKDLVSDPTDRNFEHKGSFYFTSGRVDSAGLPRAGRNDQPVSVDSNNPCPYGPCWSDGGVGRYKEYYAGGPIQNPGRPSVAASFERGLPYAYTTQGQREAQRIGIARTRAFYEHIDSYARPYWGPWGFFWLWW